MNDCFIAETMCSTSSEALGANHLTCVAIHRASPPYYIGNDICVNLAIVLLSLSILWRLLHRLGARRPWKREEQDLEHRSKESVGSAVSLENFMLLSSSVGSCGSITVWTPGRKCRTCFRLEGHVYQLPLVIDWMLLLVPSAAGSSGLSWACTYE